MAAPAAGVAAAGATGAVAASAAGAAGGGGGGGGGGRRAGADGLDVGEDVLAGDPAAAAGAGDLGGLEAVLAEQAADRRGHAGVRVVNGWRGAARRPGQRVPGRGSRGAARRGGRRLRRRPVPGRTGPGPVRQPARPAPVRGAAADAAADDPPRLLVGLDDRDLGVVGDRGPLLGQDLAQDARERRRDLGVHLVGDHLDERLVLRDRVTGLLEPASDRPLRDTLAELGHRHLGHWVCSSDGCGSRGRDETLGLVSRIPRRRVGARRRRPTCNVSPRTRDPASSGRGVPMTASHRSRTTPRAVRPLRPRPGPPTGQARAMDPWREPGARHDYSGRFVFGRAAGDSRLPVDDAPLPRRRESLDRRHEDPAPTRRRRASDPTPADGAVRTPTIARRCAGTCQPGRRIRTARRSQLAEPRRRAADRPDPAGSAWSPRPGVAAVELVRDGTSEAWQRAATAASRSAPATTSAASRDLRHHVAG